MEENKNISNSAKPAGQVGKASLHKETDQQAENIPEVEYSKIPDSEEKIIADDETTLPQSKIEKLSTLNPQFSTQNMEVHHHGHVHETKKWKEYIFQFLMLFLAVFCGFLAEYQLEHVIENQREKKYVRSLIQDLEADTASFQHYVDLRKEKRIMMDSLVMLLTTGSNKQLGNSTYFFARHVFSGPPFESTDGTMQQLKNSGNMRLIKNENVINNILSYDASVKDLKEWDETDTRIRTTFREIGGTVFNANQFYHAIDSNMKFVRPTTNPQLITDNPVSINTVTFQIQYLSISCLGNTHRGIALKTKAENLIDLLKKEYHLK